ncbi:MAG: SIS domain-containing protein [Chloroflexi bacterium]|nr:SIS domain-containing protein [Chloroflexota bacterium]
MSDVDTYRLEWDEHMRVVTAATSLLPTLAHMAQEVCDALGRGGTLIVFGNGGSAADAQHFAGELLGRFRADRRPLPAIALTSDASVVTCIANDFSYEDVFARQVTAHAGPDDVVLGMTTSGRSENVIRGLRAAREGGALAIAWTGHDPGPAGDAADLVLAVPSSTTARIQEVHTLAMHTVCVAIDEWVAAGGDAA